MSTLFELLLCPVHGVFRPDNFLAVVAGAQNVIVQIRFFLAKVGS